MTSRTTALLGLLAATLASAGCTKRLEQTPDLQWAAVANGSAVEAHWQGASQGSKPKPDVHVDTQYDDLRMVVTADGVPEGTVLTVADQVSRAAPFGDKTDASVSLDFHDMLGAVPASVFGDDRQLFEIPIDISIAYPQSKTVTSKVHVAQVESQVVAALHGVLKSPVPFKGVAPDGRGMVIAVANRFDASQSDFDYTLVGGAKNVAGIATVIFVDRPEVEHHACGPYAPAGGGPPITHELFVQGTRVRAFERATGKSTADKTFRGHPPCPSKVIEGEPPHEITGEADADKYLQKLVTDAIGSAAGVPSILPEHDTP
jgi:hypothetical protein